MGLLRSEEMQEAVLVLPASDESRKFISALGQDACIQFEDMNANRLDGTGRKYRKQVQRLEECERILRYLFEELNKMQCGDMVVKAPAENFLKADADKPIKLDYVEACLVKLYNEWTVLQSNDESLTKKRNEVAENLEVVRIASMMMGDAKDIEGSGPERPLVDKMLNSVAGVVPLEDQARFARAVWYASRGNTFTHFKEIEREMLDPKTGHSVMKTVFVILFQGNVDSQSALKDRILKVCTTFGVNVYEWPSSAQTATQKKAGLEELLKEADAALQAKKEDMRQEAGTLTAVQGPGRSSLIEEWRSFCVKEKSIYHILNCFEGKVHNLNANIWFAKNEEDAVKNVIERQNQALKAKGEQGAFLSPVQHSFDVPPTYIKTSDFTDPWQTVINTYGIPRYQEINPALFATVTFPFIFGMMYGDIGHGFLVACAGAWLCHKGEDLKTMFPGVGENLFWARYLVLQLGIYATFSGFLYNDFFSIGVPLFNTRYAVNDAGEYYPTWDIRNEGNGKGGPYPFGVDWAWHGSTNELMFMNSLKMKLSVLFGVLQMTLGVFLRFMNARFFKSQIDFFFECVPMLIFMVCFFGWMDFMIIYKWVHHIDTPPGIINSLICMAMGPMGVGQEDPNPLWPGENGGMSSVKLSKYMMYAAVVSVPWLLIPKPFALKMQHENEEKAKGNKVDPNPSEGEALVQVEETAAPSGGGGHGHGEHGEEFNMGEILIHQVIETIEYVLGTVSHTASYLRIWALSLAHQQLSLVFFQKTIGMALTFNAPLNGIAIYIAFTIWFAITCAVLLGMDVLECFLHTLRLHWVEFDSKFYKADGKLFEPYSVKKHISAEAA